MKKNSVISVFLLILSALIFSSCDALKSDPGTFAVKFSWAKDEDGNSVKPDISTGEFYVTVRIYEWKEGIDFPGDIAANGKQLVQSDPAQMLETGTSIDFGDLSYGLRRFVVAEIRKGEELTGGILFSGMSTLFEFKSGKHTEVNVEMSMTPTPGVDEEGDRVDAELRIVDDNGNLRNYTSRKDLKVKLRLLDAVSFTKVYLANSEENLKTDNGKAYKISELGQLEEVENGYEVVEEWDLSLGLTSSEIATSPELKVYARLENEYGTGLLVMAKIALDNKSPNLTLGLNPSYANGSKAISLNISADELIRHDSIEITTTDTKLVFDCPAPENNESLSFNCEIETLDEMLKDGTYTVTVSAADQAGNISEEQKTYLEIDLTDPSISSFRILVNGYEPEGQIYLKENSYLSVDLNLSETPREGSILMTLGGKEIYCGNKARMVACQDTITETLFPVESTFDLVFSYEDEAGNKYNEALSTGVRIDYTPPSLTFKKNKDAAYNATEHIVLSVTSDEQLSMIKIDGTEQSNEEISWNITGSNTTGTHEVKAEARDLAGNIFSEAVIGTYTVDAEYPDATVSAPDPARISGTGTTTVTVSDPTKEIANVKMNGVDCEKEAELFRCSFSPPSGTGDEIEPLSVSFSDLAGNSVIKTAGTVYVDRTLPKMVSHLLTPENAKEGTKISFSVIFDEPVKDLSVSDDGLGLVCSTGDNSLKYSCEHTVTENSVEKGYQIEVFANDIAGNPLSDGIVGTVFVDRTLPEITVDSCAVTTRRAITKNGVVAAANSDVVEITLGMNKETGIDPLVTLGGRTITESCETPSENCFAYTVSTSDSEGFKFIGINAVDAAGNEYNDTVDLENCVALFDFTGPVLASTVLSRIPDYTPARDNINKILSFSLNDPFTDEVVSARIDLFADEELSSSGISITGF